MANIEMTTFDTATCNAIDFDVAAMEIATAEAAAAMPVVDCAKEPADADDCFGLGMIYSSGAGVAIDLVEAHKWFNIAAMRGHGDAARLRREIAEQMADAEIGRAQRAARDWLKSHPQASTQVETVRAAA
jgi:TPR repeat protein